MNKKGLRFSPSLCITHDCNLQCVYCYQRHDKGNKMSFETAMKCINWIFDNKPEKMDEIEISFIGGEPLLEFDQMKEVFEYTHQMDPKVKFLFFATTNGTLLTEEMKQWFSKYKKYFYLGLSLDGTRETHIHNRSNSFDDIDIKFFQDTWKDQNVKMTLSEYSLNNLAENIKFIQSLGFNITGANLAEGDFDWENDEYIKILIPQLKELVDFYLKNDNIALCPIFDKRLDLCQAKEKFRKKWCGIGEGTIFFDTDGSMYPCSYVTPMTFSDDELNNIQKTDFLNHENFIDEDCFENCYIYPICGVCHASNYLENKTFKERNKKRCKIQKLIALFIAEYKSKWLLNNPDMIKRYELYHTIEAIKQIKALYLQDFT